MLLLDKGYFDYDYEKCERELRWEDTVRSDDEIRSILAGFGIGTAARKPETLEDIQNHIIKQESYGS
jgi:hypothetical protein